MPVTMETSHCASGFVMSPNASSPAKHGSSRTRPKRSGCSTPRSRTIQAPTAALFTQLRTFCCTGTDEGPCLPRAWIGMSHRLGPPVSRVSRARARALSSYITVLNRSCLRSGPSTMIALALEKKLKSACAVAKPSRLSANKMSMELTNCLMALSHRCRT
jgi:hypothetical protein